MGSVLPISKRVMLGLLVAATMASVAWLVWPGSTAVTGAAPGLDPSAQLALGEPQADGESGDVDFVEVPVSIGSTRAAAEPRERTAAFRDDGVVAQKGGSVRITILGLTEAHRAAPIRVYTLPVPSPNGIVNAEVVPVRATPVEGADTYVANGVPLGDGVAYVLFGDDEYPTIADSKRFVMKAVGQVHRTEIEVRDFSLGLIVSDRSGVPLGPAPVEFEIEPFSGLVKWTCQMTSLDLKPTAEDWVLDEHGYAPTALRCACRVSGTVIFPEDPPSDYPWIVPTFQVDVRHKAPHRKYVLICVRGAFVEGRLQRPDGAAPGGIDLFFRDPARRERVSIETKDDGTFRTPPLVPTRYLFYARVGGKDGQSYCLHEPIELQPETTHQIVDTLGISSDVVGTCVDGGGVPQENHQMTLTGMENLDLTRSGKTGKGGHFRVRGLYPGEYTVSVGNRELTQARTISVGPGGTVADLGTVILSALPDPAAESPSDQ